MLWSRFATLLSILATCNTINRPVLKIVLNQKGYAQFIQYDVEIPPLREFTLCAWVQLHDLAGDQTIFSYLGSDSARLIRLWLKSGGRQIMISINEKVTSSAIVEFAAGVWRHVCLSYQSDYGGWAMYIDSRLVFCGASQQLLGFVVPGGGSVIIGYGTSDKGSSNGLTGEIYGVSMLLISTIERNYTLKRDPQYEQKPFRKNRIKNKNKQDNKYIVLGDLQTDEIRDYLYETTIPKKLSKAQNFIHFSTPHSFIEHDVGIGLKSVKQKQKSTSGEKEILDFPLADDIKPNENSDVTFWKIFPKDTKKNLEPKTAVFKSNAQNLPMVVEYETPPSPSALQVDYSVKGLEMQPNLNTVIPNNKEITTQHMNIVPDVEKPPPPEDKPKVYGQWTSSKFVGSVLKYLRSINFSKNREPKRVPLTIPLVKISDSYPYQSEFKLSKISPPQKIYRRHFIEHQRELKKRDVNQPQINLQIIESDVRSDILKLHSETQPKLVEVTNRGETKERSDNRHYRNANDYTELLESAETSVTTRDIFKKRPISEGASFGNQKMLPNHRGSDLLSILPFLKSVEYFIDDNDDNQTKVTDKNAMYSKAFANSNKWHNVKAYSNDYTPRRINLEGKSDIKTQISNEKHPAIKLKYNHDDRKLVHVNNDEETLVKGRVLAEEVSNQANENKDSISILKYNHGFLPGHEKKMKMSDKVNGFKKASVKGSRISKNDFNKHVKLGNALNERHFIGLDEEQSKQSFVGGDDRIPDIHKYRSDWDDEQENVPSSLGPRVCRNVELYDRVLYVQPDESIDMTHILSPVREKNLGVEFILNNYKKCSMKDSDFENSFHLLIDWNKTPVRLFGGAFPKKTKDLCGFF